MDIKNLMPGIAIVIDDALGRDGGSRNGDLIHNIVSEVESADIPLYKADAIPLSDKLCDNLMQSASFVILDWKLKKTDSDMDFAETFNSREETVDQETIDFLKKARDNLVPVLILSYESSDNITDVIGRYCLYKDDNPEGNFILVKSKHEVSKDGFLSCLEEWSSQNASVYTMKAWEYSLRAAKRDFFKSMYMINHGWPKTFWSSYEQDGVNPGTSILNLINNNLIARMSSDAFADFDIRGYNMKDVSGEYILSIIEGGHFVKNNKLNVDDIRSGDVFYDPNENIYHINIRADCDCVPRDDEGLDSIELFCIAGNAMEREQIKQASKKKSGQFNEGISQSIVPGVNNGKIINFEFKRFSLKSYSDLKDKRIGRLIHPYITRIQQRYSLYMQRQGLPRIPEEAMSWMVKPSQET